MPKPASGSGRIADALLAWYDAHARDLPWRVRPQARAQGARPDPYRVWLSEVMLQQTTVKAVAPYFADFLARWPDVEALAAAAPEEVMSAWAGLGYYSRARNLHACAREIAATGGRFPTTERALGALPGVGPYTAAAVAAIAFDAPAAVIDGNVERVIARVFAIDTPLPAAKTAIRAALEPLVPSARPGDFAQALMDLGATVCTPARPACALCPVAEHCRAAARGIAETLPVKPPRKDRPRRHGAAFWLIDDRGRVLLRPRPPRGLLGGMDEIPTTDWTAARRRPASLRRLAPVAADWRLLPGRVSHVFTHFALDLVVFTAQTPRADPALGDWVAREALHARALPSVMRKVVAHADAQAARQFRRRGGA